VIIVLVLAGTFLVKRKETRIFTSSEFIQIAVADKSYAYSYLQDGKWHINFNGKDSGVYDNGVANLAVSNKNYGFSYSGQDNFYYVNIKGKIYGPYSYVASVVVADNNYGISYSSNGQKYAMIKGKIYGPYDTIDSLSVSNKSYGFVYSQNNQWQVEINGETFGPYPDPIFIFLSLIITMAFIILKMER